jgi:hypothetical protein
MSLFPSVSIYTYILSGKCNIVIFLWLIKFVGGYIRSFQDMAAFYATIALMGPADTHLKKERHSN